MKIKLGNVDPASVPVQRGVFYVRDTKYGPVVQRWPKKGKRKVTFQEYWWRTQFGIAATMAANAFPLDYEAARNMTTGTTTVPRDFLTSLAYGNAWIVYDEHGQRMPVSDKGPPTETPPAGIQITFEDGEIPDMITWDPNPGSVADFPDPEAQLNRSMRWPSVPRFQEASAFLTLTTERPDAPARIRYNVSASPFNDDFQLLFDGVIILDEHGTNDEWREFQFTWPAGTNTLQMRYYRGSFTAQLQNTPFISLIEVET